MNLLTVLPESLRSLTKNKVRTGLSVLGIVIATRHSIPFVSTSTPRVTSMRNLHRQAVP